MSAILLGDAFWSPQDPSKSVPQFILEDEIPLLHLYHQQFKTGASMVRTPTRQSSAAYLKPLGLLDRIEAVHNIAVQSAKHTQEQGDFDCLVAAVMAPPSPDFEGRTEAALEHELAEPVIYMIDKGADIMILEGFSDWDQFETALKVLKSVNQVPLPTSAFFRPKQADLETIQRLFVFGEALELEAVGLELTLSDAAKLRRADLPSDLAFGLQILGGGEPVELDRAVERLWELGPTLMLGGEGFSQASWDQLSSRLSQAQGSKDGQSMAAQ
ncbi:MAG: homocysteine S-methyltransferase family protein [bacterium]|nr:homocysteine S-methyltransferase family protein [bacterium]